MTEQGSLPIEVPDGPVNPEVVPLSSNPEFTGVRYRAQHPAQAAAIVQMYREGASISACSRAFCCSRNLVAVLIRDASAGQSIEQSKKTAAAEYRELGNLCRDRMREKVLGGADIPLRDLAVSAGIMEDKAALLSGDIPLILDLSSEPLTIEDYERRVAVEVEVRRRMGSGGQAAGQKERPALPEGGEDRPGDDDAEMAGAGVPRSPRPGGLEGRA